MRNAVIAIGFVVVVGIAVVLGWFAWQNAQPPGTLAGQGDAVSAQTSTSDSLGSESDDPGPSDEFDSDEGAQEDTGLQPPEGVPASLRFAYLWNNRLGFWDGVQAVSLAMADTTHSPQISHDGTLIAFVRDGGLWVMNHDGEQERLLVSQGEIEAMGTDGSPAYLHHFVWVAETHHLLFNTALDVEMGFVLTDDLYRVEVDSLDLVQLLPPGLGGEFTLAPDGRALAVVSPTQIRWLDPQGVELQPAFPFNRVNTYSEFAYYPQPVWSLESDRVALVVPHPEGFVDSGQPADIWIIPVNSTPDGSVEAPQFLGQVYAGAPSYWIDPALQHIAYIQMNELLNATTEIEAPEPNEGEPESADVADPPEQGEGPTFSVEIAELEGSGSVVYHVEQGRFVSWSPDGAHYIIATPGAAESLHVGSLANNELIPLAGMNFTFGHHINWMDEEYFVVVGSDSIETRVAVGHVSGALHPLFEVDAGTFMLHLPASVGFVK